MFFNRDWHQRATSKGMDSYWLLSVIWKSDLTDKMKHCFLPAVVVSILLYRCTTWILTKHMEKKIDGNDIRMLRAILNKSWRQHSIKQQLYSHLSPITKTVKVRRIRPAGHWWRSIDEFISDIFLWIPSHERAKLTYNSSVPIQDVALKTYWKRWTIKRGGRKGSGKSVLMARHDDDDFHYLTWRVSGRPMRYNLERAHSGHCLRGRDGPISDVLL